jgi:protein O-mannosyl-transferase
VVTAALASTTRRDAALIAALTLVVFAPALANDWVEWDDLFNFGDNPYYRGLGGRQIVWMFTVAWGGHWTPIAWLTLGLDYTLWGMNPFGYHLQSLLWHAANAALVFVVGGRLLRQAWPAVSEGTLRLGAGAAALFFALHPLRVESVAWITERRDLVSGFFYLLTVLCWLVMREGDGDARRRWYWAALGAYVVALLSKSIVITLPFVLLVLDVYPLRRLTPATWRRVLLEKVPFLVLALVLTVMTAVSFRSRLSPLDHYGPGARLGMAAYSLVFYAWKTLVPADLSPVYELPWRVSLLDPVFLVATLIAFVALVVLIAARRWWPAGLAVALVYALSLAPVSGVAHAGPQLVADRYSYLATLGWALLIGGALMGVMARDAAGELRPGLARLTAGALGAWILILAALTVFQVRVWHDDRALWEHALAIDPDCGHCNKAFARYHATSGEAEARLRRMLASDPRDADARIRLGAVLVQQRRFAEAETELRAVLRDHPDSAEALSYLGVALFEGGRPAEAVPVLERAISVAPGAALPRFGLGRALQMLGRDSDVEPHLVALERVEPRLAERLKRRW